VDCEPCWNQPPAKSPQSPRNQPRFVHIFCDQKSRFQLFNPEEFGQKAETDPGITQNSPQLTTKPEDPFYPQAMWSDLSH
jgi:hypothetical protein